MWIRKAPHYTAGIAEGGSTFRTTDEVDKNKDSADWGPHLTQSTVQVAAENVELVNDFVYLGLLISHERGSEAEILRRIGIARNCFSLLNKNIWKSHIHTDTKVHLYKIYILPVLLYGCETWTITK